MDIEKERSGELLPFDFKTDDEWAGYIHEADPAHLILERGLRQHQFWEHCQRFHGKQGGSHYSQFCLDRLGQEQRVSSYWKVIGEYHGELRNNVSKFAPDYLALYQYTCLPPEQQARLLKDYPLIGRKEIGAIKRLFRVEEIKAIASRKVASSHCWCAAAPPANLGGQAAVVR